MKTASGSVLTIHFDLVNSEPENVYLEGDARIIYSGELTEDAWSVLTGSFMLGNRAKKPSYEEKTWFLLS